MLSQQALCHCPVEMQQSIQTPERVSYFDFTGRDWVLEIFHDLRVIPRIPRLIHWETLLLEITGAHFGLVINVTGNCHKDELIDCLQVKRELLLHQCVASGDRGEMI